MTKEEIQAIREFCRRTDIIKALDALEQAQEEIEKLRKHIKDLEK